MPDLPHKLPRANRWTLAILAAAFALFLLWLLRYVVLPFVAAGALAYIATPIIHWLQRRFRWPRWVGAVGSFVVLLAALSAIGFGVYKGVLPQIEKVLAELPDMLRQFLTRLFQGDHVRFMGQQWTVEQIVGEVQQTMSGYASNSQDLMRAVGLGVASIMGFILTLVLLFYFLVDGPRLARGVLWVVPPAIRPEAQIVARRAGPVINRYIVGVFVVVIYATAVTWIVTHFFLGLRHALLLALAVGLLELIPVIGPVLSLLLIGLAAIAQIKFWTIVGLAIFATGLRLSIDQLIGPLVLGKAVSLPPPVVIFAFLAGGVIFGATGVIIAIPVAAVLKIILEEAYAESEGRGNTGRQS